MSTQTTLGHPGGGRYAAIWISDVHLGTRACRADLLIDFIRHHRADALYLVGDIVDGWQIRRGVFWPQAHSDVIQKILRQARKGTKVTYVAGNHDEALRPYVGLHFGGIATAKEAVHETKDGRRLWVVHGDAFDAVISFSRFWTWFGDWAYDLAVGLTTLVNRLRQRFGLEHWSLAAAIKSRSKTAQAYVEAFERGLAAEAQRRGYDGVICGHIHTPALKTIDGVLYANDGDWVENCSALVEHRDGRLEIVRWTRARGRKARAAPQAGLPAKPMLESGVGA